MSTSNESSLYEQSRKEEIQLSSCRDTSMVRAKGQPTLRVQYSFQEVRRRSLFTIPEHEALQNYNDESTAQLSKESASLFYAGKERFLPDGSMHGTKRQKGANSVDNLNNRHRCNSDLKSSERTS
ncbi:hypothetical protein RAB80_014528 [Fusarium oxysporum f. sp. vasinfectum]|uniref:Uncharacterized protein n=1 Tax=Fusarium oxysporum f. sp. vasinfectum 25433 TaxID=1089449 RepID=X0KFQ4_FUSOX|nr:hypothetical protein FOTG_19080 [Fusarium oxysporum f. sp. vasinfectum 25433]KAK2670391.1 hypothetical protein RAB80_014528 [Fusarium oxysporum f. sp. vasinfectum]KAK2930454.1 hypothetical protein FoTM2_010795 [Fusarium oxysporum f. sp. vasinfectum]